MGRKGSRYSLKDKLFYIGLALDQGVSPKSIRRQYGVHDSQVAQWIERYQAQGIDGLRHQHTANQYSEEFKTEVVKKYLAGDVSYPELARQYGVSNGSVIYQWVSLYTSGKSLTTRRAKPVKDGRKTTFTERLEIVQWTIANDKDYSAAIERFNVSYGQIYSWVRKYEKNGPDALKDRRGKAKEDDGSLSEIAKKDLRIKQLEARLEHVSTENAVLKKLDEIERRVALQKKHTKPSKNWHRP